jgi:DNA-binding NarL/FixJ family response regulator
MNTKARNKKSNSESKVIHLLIVDDHQMVRDGIKVMLSFPSKPMQFLIDEAEDGHEAVSKVLHNNYDVVLLDYNLSDKNGAAVAEDILLYKPETKILALSNYDEVAYVESMINAGAKGYILKNVEPSQLYAAIKTILSGKEYYSNEIAVKLLEVSQRDSFKIKKSKGLLTPREMEVLQLICMEKTNDEIARELFLSKRTIDTHRQRLLLKFNVKNTAGLMRAAFKLELIK